MVGFIKGMVINIAGFIEAVAGTIHIGFPFLNIGQVPLGYTA